MATAEEEVFDRLLDFYGGNPNLVIHSAHPPSGKTYFGAEVRLPKYDLDGVRTRDRHHVDYIIQAGPVLIIQELKGAASQSTADIDKLRTIDRVVGLDGIRHVLAPRVHRPELLSELRWLVLALGYAREDADCPSDFLCTRATNEGVAVKLGSAVNPEAASAIRDALLPVPPKPPRR